MLFCDWHIQLSVRRLEGRKPRTLPNLNMPRTDCFYYGPFRNANSKTVQYGVLTVVRQWMAWYTKFGRLSTPTVLYTAFRHSFIINYNTKLAVSLMGACGFVYMCHGCPIWRQVSFVVTTYPIIVLKKEWNCNSLPTRLAIFFVLSSHNYWVYERFSYCIATMVIQCAIDLLDSELFRYAFLSAMRTMLFTSTTNH